MVVIFMMRGIGAMCSGEYNLSDVYCCGVYNT